MTSINSHREYIPQLKPGHYDWAFGLGFCSDSAIVHLAHSIAGHIIEDKFALHSVYNLNTQQR